MMAGTFLDLESANDATRRQVEQQKAAFAFLPLETARTVSVVVTALLLILLGIGRARIGQRKVLPTVVETVGIAAAAAVAGLLIVKLISVQ